MGLCFVINFIPLSIHCHLWKYFLLAPHISKHGHHKHYFFLRPDLKDFVLEQWLSKYSPEKSSGVEVRESWSLLVQRSRNHFTVPSSALFVPILPKVELSPSQKVNAKIRDLCHQARNESAHKKWKTMLFLLLNICLIKIYFYLKITLTFCLNEHVNFDLL